MVVVPNRGGHGRRGLTICGVILFVSFSALFSNPELRPSSQLWVCGEILFCVIFGTAGPTPPAAARVFMPHARAALRCRGVAACHCGTGRRTVG